MHVFQKKAKCPLRGGSLEEDGVPRDESPKPESLRLQLQTTPERRGAAPEDTCQQALTRWEELGERLGQSYGGPRGVLTRPGRLLLKLRSPFYSF